MRRGTTPTHVFSVNVNLTQATVIYITYKQNTKTVVEKSIEDVTISADRLETKLSQEETLRFQKGEVEIQIRAKTADGTAYASEIIKAPVETILKEGVI